jgi:hypothetical protein
MAKKEHGHGGGRHLPKPKPKPGPQPAPKPKSVTESLKEHSTQTGDQAMAAAPSSYPAEPANAEAVYTTGPGQAVEYNYTRQGTYAEDYAQQQSQQVTVNGNPVAGTGQVMSGAANNPT